jgi:phosphomannomutase
VLRLHNNSIVWEAATVAHILYNPTILLVSFDGDADRIVFHKFKGDSRKWVLYDGDKIASLAALMIARELEEAQLGSEFSMGCVQTPGN